MKKILFVINTMGQGGAETALVELLDSIEKKDYEVSLFVLTGQGEMISKLPQNVKLLNKHFDASPVLDAVGRKTLKKTVIKSLFRRANGVRLFPYLVANSIKMIKAGKLRTDKLLWRVISDGADRFDTEYDIAISYLEGGAAYYVADHVKARKKAAFIHVDYNLAGYTRKLDKNCYLKFDKIFGVSDEVKDVFSTVYPECVAKTDVFHNLINAEKIKAKAELIDECMPQWRKDKEKHRMILTVGRLTTQKALDVSIRACRILKDKGENISWYVLGEGDQRKELERLIHELDLGSVFVLPGVVSNPYPYILQSDIYVHCSRFEGKSIAIQEAQILGKPIVVTDCSGNREQVEHRKDGMMCDLNEKEIAEIITELLHSKDLCDMLGNAARQRVCDERKELDKLYRLEGECR